MGIGLNDILIASRVRSASGRRSPPARRGFTVLELGVVVLLIAVVAAMALPNLWGAKRAANEASAVASLRTLVTACEFFKLRHDTYPASTAVLAAGGYIDSILGSGQRSGYNFGSSGGGGDGNLAGNIFFWRCYAEPVTPGETGIRHFRVNESGSIDESDDGGVTWLPLPAKL